MPDAVLRVVGGFSFRPTDDPHLPLHAAGEVAGLGAAPGTLTVEVRLVAEGPALATGSVAVLPGTASGRVVVPLQQLPELAGPHSAATYHVRVLYLSSGAALDRSDSRSIPVWPRFLRFRVCLLGFVPGQFVPGTGSMSASSSNRRLPLPRRRQRNAS